MLILSFCFQSQEYSFSLNIKNFHLSTLIILKNNASFGILLVYFYKPWCSSLFKLIKTIVLVLASLTQIKLAKLGKNCFPTLKQNCDTYTKIPASAFCSPDDALITVGMKRGLNQRIRIGVGTPLLLFPWPFPHPKKGERAKFWWEEREDDQNLGY